MVPEDRSYKKWPKTAYFHPGAPHSPKYKIAKNGIFEIFLIFPDSADPDESSDVVIIKIGLLRVENLKTKDPNPNGR